MSGPKVVNLEAVRKRRQRDSQVRIREVRDLVADWRAAMQEAGLLTEALTVEADTILARMENLRASEQWEPLFTELSARQAFFKEGTANAQQTWIARKASVRERRRRLELGMAMLRRELEAAGSASP